MKNRAKCKLCKDIIESFHDTDYVQCSCEEITVDGGNAFRCAAKNWENFLRIDDYGREISVKIHEDTTKSDDVKPLYTYEKPSKKELIDMLKDMADNIEKLPENAMHAPISHYDYWSLVTLLHSILKED